MELVDWFQPQFVLLENVEQILVWQSGTYAKVAQTRLLEMGYQQRTGLINTQQHGCPQARSR